LLLVVLVSRKPLVHHFAVVYPSKSSGRQIGVPHTGLNNSTALVDFL